MDLPQTDEVDILPEDVPVKMPDLPVRLTVNTALQFKALGDATRWRILGVIQHQPATAKQIADRIKVSPGTVGHHLQVLEEAGLAQVVARRLVRGIVAKYYTRTARIFILDFPPEIRGRSPISLNMLLDARDELAEVLALDAQDSKAQVSFPRVRLSEERAQEYSERLRALINDFVQETPDPDGVVYSLCLAFFKAPPYLQTTRNTDVQGASVEENDE
ncbi:MAG TPA: winged helix-turn-helix domain-containing protein [Ktedonobacteraceae bacterium]|nr:winged helix-turn-helix domain-containing protein [Ktedonobacteraceae bacterium]